MAPNFLQKLVKVGSSNSSNNSNGTNTPRERVSSDGYSTLRQNGESPSGNRERAKSASNGSSSSIGLGIGLGSPTTPTQANTLFNARGSSSRRSSTKDSNGSGESHTPSRIPSIITTLSGGTVGRSKRNSKDQEKDLKKEKEKEKEKKKKGKKEESQEALGVQSKNHLQAGDRTSWSSEYSSQPNFTIVPPSPLVRNGELDSDSEDDFNNNNNDDDDDENENENDERQQAQTPKTAGTQEEQPEDVVTPTLPKTNQGASISKNNTPATSGPATPTHTPTTTTKSSSSSKSPNSSAFSGSTSNTATPVGTPIVASYNNKASHVTNNNTKNTDEDNDMSNLAPGAYQVRKQPSNRSLTKKPPPDINITAAAGNGANGNAGTSGHARAATEPAHKTNANGQDVPVNGAVTMQPIVESPTDLKFPASSSSNSGVNQQSPPNSSIISPSTSTSTSSSSNAHGNFALQRENTSASVLSLSPDSSTKSKRPWRRSTTRKPTGLASAIAASGMAMANPSLSAVHNAQIQQIAPPPPPPPPPPLALPILSAGSSKGDKDKDKNNSRSSNGKSSKGKNGDLSPRSSKSRKSSVGSPPRSGGRSRRASSAKSDGTGDNASSRPKRSRPRTRPDYYGNLSASGEAGDGAGNVSYGEESHSGSGSGSSSGSGSESGSESDGRFSSDDLDGDEDGIDSLGGLGEDDIPVTGFAVASNKRNADFHELFPSVPEGDYLIEDYGCALQREILIQGRIYISENHICFHANIFGWITDLSVPIYEITSLEKKMTAFVIPNAIQITTRQSKYTFASFLSRDTTFDVIYNIWRLARPEDNASFMSSGRGSLEGAVGAPGGGVIGGGGKGSSANGSAVGVNSKGGTAKGGAKGAVGANAVVVPAAGAVGGAPARKATQCTCGKENKHYSETAMDVTLPGTPEKIHNLIFASGFIKDFMVGNQKLLDIQMSDWAPVTPGSKLLTRNFSYIKPLNGSLGPKQTKCELKDEMVFIDPETYLSTVTTTRTPDVPSGGVFSVKTRTCITWAGPISTRVLVTTQVEWTGRSFIKGIIERSAIDGQKVYHGELEKSMRVYIQEHKSEFLPEGIDAATVALASPPEVAAGTPSAAEQAAEVTEKQPTSEQLKQRERERNARGLQWAYDTFDGAWQVAGRSTKGALELIRDAWDQSTSTTILWFVIVILVLSNIWTLMRVGGGTRTGGGAGLSTREQADRGLELRRAEEREKLVHTIVKALWEELAAEKAAGGVGLPGRVGGLPVQAGLEKGETQQQQPDIFSGSQGQVPLVTEEQPLLELLPSDDLETRRAKKVQLEQEVLHLHEQLEGLEQKIVALKTMLVKEPVINDLD